MNVNESVIGEKGAQERGEKAEEAGTVVEKGLGEERWWVTSPLAERTISSMSTLFSIGRGGSGGNGSSAGANGSAQ